MGLGWIVLAVMVWAKVKGFGDGRTGCAAEPKPEGFGPNQPGPSGFRAAGAHFVGPLGRCITSTCATLRVDRLAARETELIQPDPMLLTLSHLFCMLDMAGLGAAHQQADLLERRFGA